MYSEHCGVLYDNSNITYVFIVNIAEYYNNNSDITYVFFILTF